MPLSSARAEGWLVSHSVAALKTAPSLVRLRITDVFISAFLSFQALSRPVCCCFNVFIRRPTESLYRALFNRKNWVPLPVFSIT